MDNAEKDIRLQYWRSKAKAMQNRIDDLEKSAAYVKAAVDGFDTHIIAMREWAKSVDKQLKELKNDNAR